jgi:DNA (cytosine-5)-methyltransferase 1
MIFKSVKNIKSRKEVSFFIEKISLYTKINRLIAEKNTLSIDNKVLKVISKSTINELIQIGLISDLDEISILEKTIEKPLFQELVSSVNFYLQHRDLVGTSLDKLNNTKRSELQKKYSKIKSPRIVDFFCGAGGLSLGFLQAGFNIELANDHEDVCIETFKYNHPELPENKIIQGDIKQIVDHIEKYIENDIDVVVGGPPCQGFSSANKQRIIDDPRNELYKYFLKAIKQIVPKFVVMENVKGMLPFAEQVVRDYEDIKVKKKGISYNYQVAYKVLVSDDYGVAQKRQRLIFFAVRNDIIKNKKIKPIDLFDEIHKSSLSCKKHVLSDAISFIKPLKAPRVKNLTEVDDEKTGKKVDLNSFTGNENTYLKLINRNRSIDFIFNHKARYTNDVNYEIYKKLEQGDDGTNSKISDIMPYAHRNHVFKDKYFKLIADKPSRTITAHLKMDCHSHIHPTQIRSITPREAARIQSFPDDYVFLGAYLKTYMQIGNAVPPVMANCIAKIIKKYID